MGKDKQIKTTADLEAILANVSFKNTSLDFKWTFEVLPIIQPRPATVIGAPALTGWFVQVAFERPDTQTGKIGIGRGRKELVEVGAWESGVVKTCWLLVELVVRHELMEAFHYMGVRIFNPHNSVHDLASIQTPDPAPVYVPKFKEGDLLICETLPRTVVNGLIEGSQYRAAKDSFLSSYDDDVVELERNELNEVGVCYPVKYFRLMGTN
jgi:hypothetical protein